jgi:hypothetical protein
MSSTMTPPVAKGAEVLLLLEASVLLWTAKDGTAQITA